jgi:hypothetical protein
MCLRSGGEDEGPENEGTQSNGFIAVVIIIVILMIIVLIFIVTSSSSSRMLDEECARIHAPDPAWWAKLAAEEGQKFTRDRAGGVRNVAGGRLCEKYRQ